MNKLIGGTLLVFVLAGLAWWQLSVDNHGKIRDELVLDVPDTGQIEEINILNREGEKIHLLREKKQWTVNGEPARQHAIKNLLITLHDQRVSALIPQTALDNVVKDLGSNSVRIEIKESDDRNVMTFYVGGVTPDERGTFMLREGSEWPVIVNIPGFEGGLRSRYIMSLREWKSRQVIRPVKSITSLTLDYPARQEESLVLEKKANGYQVTPLYEPGTPSVSVNKYIVEAYMGLINHLYAEAVLDDSKRKVLEESTPFCRLTIVDDERQVQEVEFYPTVWVDYVYENEKPDQVERYYTDYNHKTIYLTQHLLMQKIFTGYEHFVSLRNFDKGN